MIIRFRNYISCWAQNWTKNAVRQLALVLLGGVWVQFNATEFNRKHRPLVPSPAIVGSSPPTLPAEHASLSLHAAVPLSLLRSPSSSRDWRGVEIHRSSDWFLLLLVRNAGSLRLGCAFCDFVLRSLVFVVSPQIRIFRSARNGLRTAWLITVAFYFIFYCIMSAALLFCFLGNVKPFQ